METLAGRARDAAGAGTIEAQAINVHIQFVEKTPKPKTRVVEVQTMQRVCIGVIQWWGAWRCYAFFPSTNTLFEPKCLELIAARVAQMTQEHSSKEK